MQANQHTVFVDAELALRSRSVRQVEQSGTMSCTLLDRWEDRWNEAELRAADNTCYFDGSDPYLMALTPNNVTLLKAVSLVDSLRITFTNTKVRSH